MIGRRSGVALLEALVAMVVVGFAATGFAAAFSAAALSESGMQAREAQFAAMDRVMTAMSLLTAEDLRQRIGTSHVGELLVTVQPEGEGLYVVRVEPGPDRRQHGLESMFFRTSETSQ